MKGYWNRRFSKGKIWGELPSNTVETATKLFLNNGAKTVLVPGAGYGRNSKALATTFKVDAIELSQQAIATAKEHDKSTSYIEGSVFDLPIPHKKYDGIYCYNLLHLFLLSERMTFIQKCIDQLAEDGMIFLTCFSNEDSSYGQGVEVEKDTFEYKPGKVAHFFSEEDLVNHFKHAEVIQTGSIDEKLEYIDQTERTYKLRYIIAKK
ncbi:MULTISPECIES: class I SAM-dependent methyltransferase [Bacillaceae]|uniref:class I SAM-dependent methyltransferase n=1 Tax=Bacillaceae TaxID=186817 RepID=UPI001BDDF458|nr:MULTISPECIES: class I SAM-dependent methyltransferase [Bacillaceae]MDX8362394.1 class I SAM-dependent methyltransferase [Cytobacillus sp. IB215316]